MKIKERLQELLVAKVVVCQVSERDIAPVSDAAVRVLRCIRAVGVLAQTCLPGVFFSKTHAVLNKQIMILIVVNHNNNNELPTVLYWIRTSSVAR